MRKIFFHNVQSLLFHKLDVEADNVAMQSEVLFFVEPHLLETDRVDLKDFCVKLTVPFTSKRNSEGMVVFEKNTGMYDCKKNLEFHLNFYFMLLFFSASSMRPGMVDSGKDHNGHHIIFKCHIDSVLCICTYKSPEFSNSVFSAKIRECLQNIEEPSVFFGDDNVCLYKPEAAGLLKVLELCGSHSMLPSHCSTTNGGSQFDCCFKNFDEPKAWIYESYYSYHKPICITWSQ